MKIEPTQPKTVMDESITIYCTIRSPWHWCLESVTLLQVSDVIPDQLNIPVCSSWLSPHKASAVINTAKVPIYMSILPHFSLLPSKNLEVIETSPDQDTPTDNKSKTRRLPQPCTLRLELVYQETSQPLRYLIFSAHGTSSALDGCSDKDQLVRTINKCKDFHDNILCDEITPMSEYLSITGLYISDICPWSILVEWDATYEQIVDLVTKHFPRLVQPHHGPAAATDQSDVSQHLVAVLKAPLGSRGEGVFFVSKIQQIWDIIRDNKIRAMKEPPEFMINLIKEKGRIPAWVLQREVYPPMLLRQRKFHLRSYILVIEQKSSENLHVLLYNRHEVRIAFLPMNEHTEEGPWDSCRDRQAHITNGACSDKTERALLHHVHELQGVQGKLEYFLAKLFGQVLLPDMMQRTKSAADRGPHLFAIAGVDVMIDTAGTFYLLEVNVNPAAPPSEVITSSFREHLVGFMTDLIQLQLYLREAHGCMNETNSCKCNFIPAQDILARPG